MTQIYTCKNKGGIRNRARHHEIILISKAVCSKKLSSSIHSFAIVDSFMHAFMAGPCVSSTGPEPRV